MKTTLLAVPLFAGVLGSVLGLGEEELSADWRVVGAYDATSAMAMNPEDQEGYVWVPLPVQHDAPR